MLARPTLRRLGVARVDPLGGRDSVTGLDHKARLTRLQMSLPAVSLVRVQQLCWLIRPAALSLVDIAIDGVKRVSF